MYSLLRASGREQGLAKSLRMELMRAGRGLRWENGVLFFFFSFKGLQCSELNKEGGRETIGVQAPQCPVVPESNV